jgi:hypothetical protein
MSRLSRLSVIWFGWYYVALHAENGRRLLTSRSDLAAFLRILSATLHKRGARLHGCYVGEREIHLALQMGEKTVSALTATLCHDYARFFNRTHRQGGSLFKPHAHVLLIQQPPWLIPLVQYIHRLAEVRAPDSVWWSSDAVYRRGARMNGLVTTVILRSLSRGSRSHQKQDEAYARRFGEVPDPDHVQRFLHGSPLDPRILGDDAFVSNVWRLTGQRPAQRGKMSPRNDELILRTLVGAMRRLRKLCERVLPPRQASAWVKTLTLANVCAMSRKHPLPMIRALCVSYLLERHLATRIQAARLFGCRPESLSAGWRQRNERKFHQLFNQPYSTLFASGRCRLLPSEASPSTRDTSGDETPSSTSDQSGDELFEIGDPRDTEPGRDAATQPRAAVGDHLSSTYVARYLVSPVRVPTRASNVADARWNRMQARGWRARDGARPCCRPARQRCSRSHVTAWSPGLRK